MPLDRVVFCTARLRFPGISATRPPCTESLYSHFTGVKDSDTGGDEPPYPVDDAAVHHVFDGGWVWVLRFNNGVTSAGVTATHRVAKELALSEGEPAWQRLLHRLPGLKSQFEHASRASRSGTCRRSAFAAVPLQVSDGLCCLPRPVLLTLCFLPVSLTFTGIERLAQILLNDCDSAELSARLQGYAEQTDCNLWLRAG